MITLGRQAISALPITSTALPYTVTGADNAIIISGTSGTVTLLTAVGNAGKQVQLIHSGTSLTQVYTINTTSAQTIGGVASGAYALYTNNENLILVSDGANWIILDHLHLLLEIIHIGIR